MLVRLGSNLLAHARPLVVVAAASNSCPALLPRRSLQSDDSRLSLLIKRNRLLQQTPADQQVPFTARVPPYDVEVDRFSVACLETDQPLWTRQAVMEAVLSWHSVLGAEVSSEVGAPPADLDRSIVQLAHERAERQNDGSTVTVRRIVQHIFVGDESQHLPIQSLNTDWERFLAFHPRENAPALWEVYRRDISNLIGMLVSRVLSPRLRAVRTIPSRESFSKEDHIMVHSIDQQFIPAILQLYTSWNDFPQVFSTIIEQADRVQAYWESSMTPGVPPRNNTLYVVLEFFRILAIILQPIQPVASQTLAACFPNTHRRFEFLRFGFFHTKHIYIQPETKLFFTPPVPVAPKKAHKLQLRQDKRANNKTDS